MLFRSIIKKLEKNLELYQKLKEKIFELAEFQMSLAASIEKIDDVLDRAVLTYRYINNDKWEIIAQKIGYSVMHTHRIHKRALKKFSVIECYS